MSLKIKKKFKPKSHKATVKRLKITSDGKIKVNRVNAMRGHRMIKKRRQRVLQGKRDTVLSPTLNKLKTLVLV